MILRTYLCADCNHTMTVELRSDQWNEPPPICPVCDQQQMGQHFKPPAIGGSHRARATDLALDIAEKDYGVADIKGNKEGPPTVRYKDTGPSTSSWGVHSEALSQAVALGRQTRLQHGSSLDVIKAMPDPIEASKRRSARIW